MLNAVSSCHAVDVQSVSDFIPNSMNHVHTMIATASVIRARNSSKHERRSGIKTLSIKYRGADKSLARPGRKQATATQDFDVHIYYL